MAENELAEVVGDVPAIPAAEEEAAAPESTPAETPPVDEAPSPDSLKSEIEDLQRQKEDAKAAAQKWRKEKADARADYFRSKTREPEIPPAQPAEAGRPDPDTFDDYNDYVDALTDYKVDAKKRQWDKEQVDRDHSTQHQEKLNRLQEKINQGFEKYPDFEDVALAETVPITPMIQEVLMETENPEDIAYYLGKNQTRLIAIGRMTPIAAARAIAQIEAEIAGTTPAAPATPKKTTNAPKPITPVGSSNSIVNKDPEKMTQAEYSEWRKSQGARPF